LLIQAEECLLKKGKKQEEAKRMLEDQNWMLKEDAARKIA